MASILDDIYNYPYDEEFTGDVIDTLPELRLPRTEPWTVEAYNPIGDLLGLGGKGFLNMIDLPLRGAKALGNIGKDVVGDLAKPADLLGELNDLIFMKDKGLGKLISDHGPGVLESMFATPSPGAFGLPEESPIDKFVRAPATFFNWAVREGVDLGKQGLGQADDFVEWLWTSPTETSYVSPRDLERAAEQEAIGNLPPNPAGDPRLRPPITGETPGGSGTSSRGYIPPDVRQLLDPSLVPERVTPREDVENFVRENTDPQGNTNLDLPISPLFPYTLRELLDADIVSVQDLAAMQRRALQTARQDYSQFLNEILYGTEEAPGFLAATGGALDRFRGGMEGREAAFSSRRSQLFDELAAAGVDPSLIAEDLAAGDSTAEAIAAIEGGYAETLGQIGGLAEAAMRREGRGRFDSAGRQIDLGEAAALAGIEQAGRQAEMFAPYAEVDPGLFYSGARAGLPIVQMAETRRGERRADARGAAAQAAAEAEQQATMGYLSQYLGVPPELIAALSSVGQLDDLFPEFEEPDPTWIYDETGRAIGHQDAGRDIQYRIDQQRLLEMLEPEDLSIMDQLYAAFPDDAPALIEKAIEQVSLSRNAINFEQAIQNALLAASVGN